MAAGMTLGRISRSRIRLVRAPMVRAADDELPVGERQRGGPDHPEQLRCGDEGEHEHELPQASRPQNASMTRMASSGGKASRTNEPALRSVSPDAPAQPGEEAEGATDEQAQGRPT